MNRIVGAVGLLVSLAACGVSESQVAESDPSGGEDSAELSSTSRTYVALRRDMRRCIAPLCGGYWVHDVNRVTLSESYVSGLDFSQSGLSDAEQQRVYEGLEDVILRGKLGPTETRFQTRPFIVSEAFRGLPGKGLASGDGTFKLRAVELQCVRAPCPNFSAVKANYAAQALFHKLSLSGLGFVDQAWLQKRLLTDGALAFGQMSLQGEVRTFNVSDVYLKLPEQMGPCPLVKQPACSADQVRVYQRNADRCVVPSQCVKPGVCNFALPTCGEGYTAVSWEKAPNACKAVACDPSWIF